VQDFSLHISGERDRFREIGIDGKIILKLVLKKQDLRACAELN